MKRSEVAELLAYTAAIDRREIGATETEVKIYIEAWTNALETVTDLEDAKAAVSQHYAATSEYLMPIHIIERYRSIRDRRFKLDKSNWAPGPDDVLRPALLEFLQGVDSGAIRPFAIAPQPPDPEGVQRASREARAIAHGWTLEFVQQREESLTVPCTDWCKAPVGEVCVHPGTDEPLMNDPAHPSRLVRAGVIAEQPRRTREEYLEALEAMGGTDA